MTTDLDLLDDMLSELPELDRPVASEYALRELGRALFARDLEERLYSLAGTGCESVSVEDFAPCCLFIGAVERELATRYGLILGCLEDKGIVEGAYDAEALEVLGLSDAP